jgi:uncharacterized membrane protein
MKPITFIFAVILTLQLASATYISGDITIKENGAAIFNLETDIPISNPDLTFQNEQITGTTEFYSSKQAGIWTFHINFGNYDNILLDIKLPKNLDAITSIEGTSNLIDFSSKTITLADSGELNFNVSYKLKETTDLSFLFWIFLIIILIILFVIYTSRRRKKDRIDNIKPLVSEIEEKIINILMKSSKRQKELRKSLNIPKASFSRYISNLEKKKLIIREGEGKNKIVKLK